MKRDYFCALIFLLISTALAGAYEVSEVEINSTYSQFSIEDIFELYAFEVNLDYTGDVDVYDSEFLGDSSFATYGFSERDSILSVYGSRLDSAASGVNGTGELFNVSYDGTVALRYVLAVYANGSEEYVYYNASGGSGSSGSSGGSSGGGGGGGGVGLSPGENLVLEPEILSVELKQGETKRISFVVRNNGTGVLTIDDVRASPDLFDFLKLSERSLSLGAGEEKVVFADVLAPEDASIDSYIGTISVSAGSLTKRVNLVIDVKASSPLFDVLVDVDDEVVAQGEDVTALIEIFNLGDLQNIDVLLEYAVRNFEGDVIASAEESLAIERRIAVIRQLLIPEDLASGTYVLYARAAYGDDVQATGTKTFRVEDVALAPLFDRGTSGYYVLIGAVILGVLGLVALLVSIIVLLVRRRQRKIAARRMQMLTNRNQREVYVGG